MAIAVHIRNFDMRRAADRGRDNFFFKRESRTLPENDHLVLLTFACNHINQSISIKVRELDVCDPGVTKSRVADRPRLETRRGCDRSPRRSLIFSRARGTEYASAHNDVRRILPPYLHA